jgi:hypothetical protein
MSIIEKVKARSITSKAKAACQINMGLVQGAADVQNSKGFTNYSSLMDKSSESATESVVPVENKDTGDKNPKDKDTDDKSKGETKAVNPEGK